MSIHEQFAEDLSLYAMGVLTGDSTTALESHLKQCASCRRELERLRGDLGLLALSALGPKPPERGKARLLEAIRQEPRLERTKPRSAWWAAFGWVAAAVLIVGLGALWQQNARLKSSVAQLTATVDRQKVQLADAQNQAEVLKSPDVAHFDVLPVSFKSPPPPYGNAIYSRQAGGLIFMASNLDRLPPQKAYELWLVPKEGTPIPAGVFKPDSHGRAILVNPPLPRGVEAKAFAITVEPEQGSQTPTLPIIMMGAGA
ncbi:MAG: anti-sigma factor [Acidobacteria bacterium]|nr:anti-sigma factor [Acidobacteriota bacterium]